MQYDDDAEKYGYEGEMTTMKCDELKAYVCVCDGWCCKKEAYPKDKADEAIAELKEAWRSEHEACETLKKKLEDVQASHYAEMVDAGMENRRLKRALFIAHAIKARFKWWWMSECKHNESCKLRPDPRKIKKFTNSAWVCSKSQEKCRAKAEEYK